MIDALKIAGRSISIAAWLNYDQQVVQIGGSSVRRKANGAAFKMTGWQRHRVTISASGWTPPALIGINTAASFELELPQPLAFAAGEALPAGWTNLREETVTDAAGNTARLVWVKLTVLSDGPTLTSDNTANPSWEMAFETV